MPFTNTTKPTQGEATKKSLADVLIDNDTYFHNVLGGSGIDAVTGILNGSFENDVDGDGIPDEWVLASEHASGTYTIDATDYAHGAKSLKTTSTGSGGYNATTSNYSVCSPKRFVNIDFLLKSSVAGVRNTIDILWYKADKTASATTSTNVYDSSSNPTSWTRITCGANPPSDAYFYKVKVTGCKAGTAVAGSTWFDDFAAIAGWDGIFFPEGTIAEDTTGSTSWEDNGSVNIWLPLLSANSHVRITFRASSKVNATNSVFQRFRVGSEYSNETEVAQTTPTFPYVENTYTLDLIGNAGGAVTIWQQLKLASAVGLAYGRKDKPPFHVQILAW